MPDISSLSSIIGISKDVASVVSFLLLFVGAAVALGFVLGRNKLVNVFINIYIALTLASVIPGDFLVDSDYAGAILFVILLVFLTAIDQHLFDLHIPNASYDIFWRLLVMGALVVGMTVSVVASLLPKKFLLSLPFPFLLDYFGAPVANLLWLTVPLLLLIFMNKRLK